MKTQEQQLSSTTVDGIKETVDGTKGRIKHLEQKLERVQELVSKPNKKKKEYLQEKIEKTERETKKCRDNLVKLIANNNLLEEKIERLKSNYNELRLQENGSDLHLIKNSRKEINELQKLKQSLNCILQRNLAEKERIDTLSKRDLNSKALKDAIDSCKGLLGTKVENDQLYFFDAASIDSHMKELDTIEKFLL